MRVSHFQIREHLRESLWFIPTLGVLTAVLLAQCIPWIDRGYTTPFSDFFGFPSGPEGARLLLSTIAASTLTLTALVFSVTMLVLQLATNQLSPRVMRTFLRDRDNQIVLALFVGTFTYALLALRLVYSDSEGGVPTVTAWLGFALALLSIGAFVYYIHHMAQAIRASSVLASIAAETLEAIERLYPELALDEPEHEVVTPERAPDHVLRWPGSAGVIMRIDIDTLATITSERNLVVAVHQMVGDFVPHEMPVLSVWGHVDESVERLLVHALSIGRDRSMDQDAAFGFRQLVDIAERALSPGINDPTTAVQAIDRIHDLLRQLAVRAIPAAERVDATGELRMILPRLDWSGYVALGIEEIRLYGGRSLQVVRRLRVMIEDLQAISPGTRQAPIARQLALLDQGLRFGFDLDGDRQAAVPTDSGRRR